ncbi:peptidoglycan-binding protein [Nonomuraea sp. NPDC050556]|uniref:peptidoglycan-binding protein n=1 Tax=Nonomuraea sp. NPDC050556 TaxID=3364369 RepID=UPI0037993B46
MTTPAKVIAQARRDLGMREKPDGSNLVPITKKFGKIPGYPSGGYGYPWCAAATSIWCKRAGMRPNIDYPHTAGTKAQYAWAKARGRWFSSPKAGDLVLFTRGGANGIYHVELVEKVTAATITTVGGNTSGRTDKGVQGNGNGVYRKTLSRMGSRIYGYVRPFYDSTSTTPGDRVLEQGDRGQDVLALKKHMRTLGYTYLGEDISFGPLTHVAVMDFQARRGLTADGEIGPKTKKALGL